MKLWTEKNLLELQKWESPTIKSILAKVNPLIEMLNHYETAINSLPPDVLVHWTHVKFGDQKCNCSTEIVEQFRSKK